MHPRAWIKICCFLFCFFIVSIAFASNESAKRTSNSVASGTTPPQGVNCSRTLQIAISPQAPALSVNRQNQVTGILSDFFNSVEENSRCRFAWDFVPRARAVHYLKNGLTDIVFAIRTEERDRHAEFIPLLEFYPSLIVSNDVYESDEQERMLENEQLRFGFIKGYDFGKDYLDFVNRMKLAKRGEEVIEVEDVARRMAQGQYNATIMSATVFVQAAQDILLDQKIQAIPLKQFPKAKVGIYLSLQTMRAEERRLLRDTISNRTQVELLYRLFKAHYPAWAMKAISPANPNSNN